MLEITRGDLHRGAALDGDHEDVIVPEIEVADPVLTALETVLHDGRVGPVGPGGRLRRRDETRGRVRHKHVEGDVATVRGPANPAGRFEELGEGGRLAGVHPAQVDLAVRRVGYAGAVG